LKNSKGYSLSDDLIAFPRAADINVFEGDALTVLRTFPDKKYSTCVTSPPYFNQRDYNVEGQIGLEISPRDYIKKLVAIFHEVKRVLRDDGTLWLNIGDTYANQNYYDCNVKPRDLLGIPWRIAFALQEDGWYLRQDIIWDKPDTIPEPVKTRCVKSHEYLFLLSKKPSYYFDYESIREIGVSGKKGVSPQQNSKLTHGEQSGGNTGINAAKVKMLEEFLLNGVVTRNRRSVWTVSTQSGERNEHYAQFPPKLIEPCIIAGSPYHGWILDPFAGSGTTGMVARDLGRCADLIELNADYAALARRRACWK